jgi:hypothetical protein
LATALDRIDAEPGPTSEVDHRLSTKQLLQRGRQPGIVEMPLHAGQDPITRVRRGFFDCSDQAGYSANRAAKLKVGD